jgi:hypothetical protein
VYSSEDSAKLIRRKRRRRTAAQVDGIDGSIQRCSQGHGQIFGLCDLSLYMLDIADHLLSTKDT